MYRQDWNDCEDCDLVEHIANDVLKDSEMIALIEMGLEQLNTNAYKYRYMKRKRIVKLIKKFNKIKEVMK